MKFKENRKLAFIILAVVVIFSITVQGSVAMLNRRGDTEVLFMEGDMRELMRRCADQAELLGQMGGMYLNDASLDDYASANTANQLRSGGYTALPGELETLSAQLVNAADPNESLIALTKLHDAVEKTYTGLDMLDIPEAEFRNIKLAYYDFTGAVDIVSRDGDNKDSYTAKAQKFNKEISAFPASLISGVLGVNDLYTYPVEVTR